MKIINKLYKIDRFMEYFFADQRRWELRAYLNGIDNTNDDGDDAGIGISEHLARSIALTVDQHGISDTGVGIIHCDKILVGFFTGQGEWLNHQQPPVLIMRVADGGDDCSDYFSNDHFSNRNNTG